MLLGIFQRSHFIITDANIFCAAKIAEASQYVLLNQFVDTINCSFLIPAQRRTWLTLSPGQNSSQARRCSFHRSNIARFCSCQYTSTSNTTHRSLL